MERKNEVTPTRRGVELALTLFAFALGAGSYLLFYVNRDLPFPSIAPLAIGCWLVLCVGAHLLIRKLAPYADPVLLPCVLLLNGLGLAMLNRLNYGSEYSPAVLQFTYTTISIVAFGVVLRWLGDYRSLQRYTYILFCIGLGLLLMPLLPVIGKESGGSRIWIEIFGRSFQPAEVAKIVLTLAFASYLSDHRELLRSAGRRFLGVTWPRIRDLGPIAVMWVVSLAVLVFQSDLGTSLLFFGLFVAMLYVATDQVSWAIMGLAGFVVAAVLAYLFVGKMEIRVESWLNPFADVDRNYQVIEGQFGLAWGGLMGRGIGIGRPTRIPLVDSDFISAAFGEELGLVGMFVIILLYALLVMRGLRAALSARDWFGKLLASGLSFALALQVVTILGGVTRLLPLTGLTTPFMSQGGSSLLANWLILAILLLISHRGRAPIEKREVPVIVDLAEERTVLLAAVKPEALA
ncbi:MAG: FtsW/RodA/SpoVE family cell cycle protein [Propionibacteriaceae bacterium]|jgi:cell division protein FtsW (lipid II flippase)|nr:FtsW/RodA/SpoVE family cell cycle protein [Propionibacteriaceae bacterium]